MAPSPKFISGIRISNCRRRLGGPSGGHRGPDLGKIPITAIGFPGPGGGLDPHVAPSSKFRSGIRISNGNDLNSRSTRPPRGVSGPQQGPLGPPKNGPRPGGAFRPPFWGPKMNPKRPPFRGSKTNGVFLTPKK